MTRSLERKKVAFLVANGFIEEQMTESQRSLLQAGAKPSILSMEQGLVNSWNGIGWGHHFAVEHHINDALAADFDILVIPGGARSLTKLKTNPHTKRIIAGFARAEKPIALFDDATDLLSWAECDFHDKILHITPDETTTDVVQALTTLMSHGSPLKQAA